MPSFVLSLIDKKTHKYAPIMWAFAIIWEAVSQDEGNLSGSDRGDRIRHLSSYAPYRATAYDLPYAASPLVVAD